MISQKMEQAINQQINAELYSSYLYLSMAAYLDSQNLKGMAQWMKAQAQEEVLHAMKFYHYLYDRGGKVVLKAIDMPQSVWESPLKVFEAGYEHEQKVTVMIHELVKLAKKENDYASEVFLSWYVSEQIEEEADSSEIVETLKMIGKQGPALMQMDRKLGERKLGAAEDV
ncbi:MAG: ferritin [Candidatus Delongbacteria bacterium]|nr:ferritin [Candidatus Delongbacteria bacterium]